MHLRPKTQYLLLSSSSLAFLLLIPYLSLLPDQFLSNQPQPATPKLLPNNLASPTSSHPYFSVSSRTITSNPNPQLQAHLQLLFTFMLPYWKSSVLPSSMIQQIVLFLLSLNSLPRIPSFFYSISFRLVFQKKIQIIQNTSQDQIISAPLQTLFCTHSFN